MPIYTIKRRLKKAVDINHGKHYARTKAAVASTVRAYQRGRPTQDLLREKERYFG